MKVQNEAKKDFHRFSPTTKFIIERMITKVHRNIINFQKKITKVQQKDYKLPAKKITSV